MELLEIHDRHFDRVKHFVLGIVKDEWLADDLVQETFIRVQKNIKSLKDPSKTSAWVFRIAYNLCQDHFKSRKKIGHEIKGSRDGAQILAEVPVHRELEQLQMGACVQEQINLLPRYQRIVLILYDLLGFKHNEIAEILDISRENTKVRLHRARKNLRSILEANCSFEMDDRNVLVCEPKENGPRRRSASRRSLYRGLGNHGAGVQGVSSVKNS